jgi:hypothetical protein
LITRRLKLLVCLASVCTVIALAETKNALAATPVAYVYVARPTHIDGFAVSSTGKLTPVPGSPFANIAVSHLSATKKFLFGAGDNGQDIYTFAIAANGSIQQVAVINPHKYDPIPCTNVGPIQLDRTGTTLYNYDSNCENGVAYIQSFKIESNGDLQFLAYVGLQDGVSPLAVLGNNQYAYQEAGNLDSPETIAMKRESNGALVQWSINVEPPSTGRDLSYYGYAPLLAADPTNHLAAAVLEQIDGAPEKPTQLATFTVASNGNLTTTSNVDNMPFLALPDAIGLSISPSAKLLAVAEIEVGTNNYGFQVFHFDGGSPITKYTGLQHESEKFVEFGWDSDNHLYALSNSNLHVYTATSSSVKELSGSPYSIPEAVSVIVVQP